VNDADLPQPRATMNEVGDNLPRKPPAFAIEELWLRYFKPRILHMMSRKDAGDAVLSNADQVIQRNLATLDKETHLPRLAELGS
jgi:hypothetical protein